MSNIFITNTMLGNLGKKGILKPDAHGYRTHVLGAFGIMNSGGIPYHTETSIRAIETNSIMKRKLLKGMLMGEADHPSILGLDDMEALERMLQIWVKYTSHNIAGLTVVTDKYRDDKTGKFLTVIEGKLRPSDNHYGNQLEKDLDDPNQNTAFSIRSILDMRRSTDAMRYIKIPITWDRVDEPGISLANKYQSFGCESHDTTELLKFQCRDEVANDLMQRLKKHGGTESATDIVTLLSLATNINTNVPAFLR